MSKTYFSIFFLLTLLVFASPAISYAEYQRAEAGDTIQLGEFVYDDDYVATTTPCTITIYNPSGSTVVNAQAMTSDANGWHYYDFDISAGGPEGVWPSHMACGSTPTGDLIKVDKTFIVGATIQASSTIASAVWNSTTRTLSSFGSLISDTVSSVWSAATRTLTGSSLTSGSLATVSDVQTASSSLGSAITAGTASVNTNTNSAILTASSSLASAITASTQSINAIVQSASSSLSASILTNRSLITALNNISAQDVWEYADRTLTNSSSTDPEDVADAVWNRASAQLSTSGSIGKLLADNIDATISSRGTSNISANDVWAAGTRTLTEYATSSLANAAALAVWSNGTRTLSNYGNDITAADVWNTLTSTLTSVGSVGKLLADNIDTTISSRASLTTQNAQWFVTMSDYSSVQAGETYRAKVQVLNESSVAEDPFAAPEVTLYDADRNITVSAVSMTHIGTGLYEYTYSVSSSAAQGVWETIVNTEVENGKTITNNDYWLVAGSPAQVIINSVTANAPDDISANVTITNEGLAGYEYHYEWCVVSSSNNPCGDGDDVYHATAAKFINPSEDWNTNLSAEVSSPGSYYFKLVVYFGTEQSGSSRSFTVEDTGEDTGPTNPGGGGGGGGGTPRATVPTTPTACVGADFNHDNFVNSTDFSILLTYWRTTTTPANPCVDINRDTKVDAIDFSIMLSQWGTRGRAI